MSGIVAQDTQRPVDVVQRRGVVAPDPVGQPQISQRVRRRERVVGLFGCGQGLAGGRLHRVQVAGADPLEHCQPGQNPGPPLTRQVRRRQRLSPALA